MLMKFKYEKEFREAHPETTGEKDSAFDLCNYTEWLETIVSRVELPVKHDFCDNTLRLNTTELDILIDVFEGATKNIDQYRVLNRLLKHKLKIIESISKNSV